MSNTPSISPPSRFAFVDGLRGLAALGIVVFHIWRYEPHPHPAFEATDIIPDALFMRLRAGVQILLVISGFVIAYTLRNTWVNPREIVWFVARRLVRLVPTYWFSIGIVILLDVACRQFWDLKSPAETELSVLRVTAHMTFLQEILGQDALSAGMWTICIEMQFYILAILGWGIAQWAFRRPLETEPRPSSLGLLVVFAPIVFCSLFYWRGLESTDDWVIHYAWMFFLGMITWWTLDRTVPLSVSVSVLIIAILELVIDAPLRQQIWCACVRCSPAVMAEEVQSWRYENFVALATALAILTAGVRNTMSRWLNWNWLQYCGRISYSLYLIHFPVCHLITMVAWKYFGDSPTAVQSSAVMLVSLIASLFAAHFMYVVVETPSATWAAKMKQNSA